MRGDYVLIMGCSTIHYVPDSSKTGTVEAREIVKQVIQEQPDELAPIRIEITDRYLKMYATKSHPVDGYTIPWNTMVYFSNIGNVELKQKKRGSQKWFVISIRDRNNTVRYTVYTAHEITAKSFIDALHALKVDRSSESAMKSNL